jgi:predicted glycosyltransferase involved in capsule biosynthesis
VYPYEDYFYDVPEVIRRIFIEKKDLKVLKQTTSLHKPLYTPGPVGGAFMVNRRRYIEAGMENEHFYGWGPEDRERYIRWYKLGYKVGRIKGPLYHLYHTRGINSTFHDPIQDQIKDSESYAFNRMTKEQLRSEVDRWKWVPKTTK